MNKTLTNIIRINLLEELIQCTEAEQLFFKRMYSHKNLELPIEQVVQNMPDDKLDWAFSQAERTNQKRNNGKVF